MIRRALLLLPLLLAAQAQGQEIDVGWLKKPKCCQWYVDSVNGSDTNSGTSPSQALKTIAGLTAKTIAAGDKIGLARGSYWREMLYMSGQGIPGGLPNGVQILAYGSGARPIFDGADVIPAASWTKTAGRTNVYQATVDTSIVPAYLRGAQGNRIWENWTSGANGRLLYVADVATCDATPGSWTGPTRPTGGSDVFYVHASDNTNPATNGKVYEWPARSWGVNGGMYSTDSALATVIRGVKVQRHSHHNGGLLTATYVGDFEVDTGGAGTVDPYHGLWNNGIAEDGITTSTVSYGNNVGSQTWRRVQVNCSSPIQGTPNNGSGFYFHTGGVGLYKHGKMLFEDVSGSNCNSLLGGDAATQMTVIRATATDNTVRQLFSVSNVDRIDVVGARWVRNTASDDNGPIVVTGLGSGGLTIFGSRFVTNRAAPYAAINVDGTGTGSVTLTGNSFVFTAGPPNMSAGYRSTVASRVSGGAVTMSRNLIAYGGNPLYLPSSTNMTADRNLYDTGASGWNVNGTTYATFALWKASGRDTNGVQEAITLAGDPATGNTATSGGSAATIGAGADAWGDANAAAYISTIP